MGWWFHWARVPGTKKHPTRHTQVELARDLNQLEKR